VALGTLRNRAGRVVTIQCKLARVDKDELAGFAAGTAYLNESEWAMLGRSVQLKPEDRRPQIPTGVELTPVSITDTVIDRADERARGPHPLEDPTFAYPIRIAVGGKPLPYVFKRVGDGETERTECFVPVHAGDELEIWVGNRSGSSAMMRLLVDGLSTLLEPSDDKGVRTLEWGKRVNLDEAKAWRLDPHADGVVRREGVPTWAARGFLTELDAKGRGKYRAFKVVEADQSLAARQRFTDQIGVITAAFYADAGGSRSTPRFGITGGREGHDQFRTHNSKVGNLLSVVHIRYVDADALRAE
jgi:hypothetical protein